MKVAEKIAFFSELKRLCKPDMGLIPKSAVVQAFETVQFYIKKERGNNMKKVKITLSDRSYTKEHNQAMADLVEFIAPDFEPAGGDGTECSCTVEVGEKVFNILMALSNADCMYVEEIE